MKTPTTSTLQRRILLSLANKNASSISALARDLEIKRPSASRAVKLLADANLIARQKRGLSLTETGQEEVKRLIEDIPIKAKKATGLASHILGQAAESLAYTKPSSDISQILKSVPSTQMIETLNTATKIIESIPSPQMMRTLNAAARIMENIPGIQIMETLNTATKIMESIQSPQMMRTLNATAKIMESMPSFQMMEAINTASKVIENIPSSQIVEAIDVTVRVQKINLDWLELHQKSISSALNRLVIKNNFTISNMMVDLKTIAEIEFVNSQVFSSLINQTARTVKTYDAYFDSASRSLDILPTVENLSSIIVVPTTTTASVVGSARGIVEAHVVSQTEETLTTSTQTNVRVYSEQYTTMTSTLEKYLKPLGERFLDKWEGAWHTLYSENKDRHSQATHSGRELLMQVLAHIAPDEAFTKEDCIKCNVDKPSRKMRIRYILRSNDKHLVDLIDSVADTLDEMYHVLTKEAHRRDDNKKDDDAVAAMIAGLGSFLIMLLSMRNNKLS